MLARNTNAPILARIERGYRPYLFDLAYTVLKMTVRSRGEGRYGFVLLVLCLLAVAQVSAFASANEQHHSQDHCCLLCHVGPMPFLHTNVAAVVLPSLATVWLEPVTDCLTTHDVLRSISSSRAPPA